MSRLSKLHVRYIQSHKKFSINQEEISLNCLYIKNSENFYLANPSEALLKSETFTLTFKDKTDYLHKLNIKIEAIVLEKSLDEYQNAIDFFQMKNKEINSVMLLNIKETI